MFPGCYGLCYLVAMEYVICMVAMEYVICMYGYIWLGGILGIFEGMEISHLRLNRAHPLNSLFQMATFPPMTECCMPAMCLYANYAIAVLTTIAMVTTIEYLKIKLKFEKNDCMCISCRASFIIALEGGLNASPLSPGSYTYAIW